MFRDSTGLWFSPSDLVVFLESEFAAFVDRWELEKRTGKLPDEFRRAPKGRGICVDGDCVPDGPDEEADLYKRQGTKHELAFLKELHDSGHCIVEIVRGSDAFQKSLEAIRSGAMYVYQPRVESMPFVGFADFLERRPGMSRLGDFHYEVLDTKLGRTAKPSYVVQLTAYTLMLAELQDFLAERSGVVLGNGRREYFRTNRFRFYFERFQRAFLESQERFDPACLPHPGSERAYGRWSTFADQILATSDHLRGVANITASQIEKLERAGIPTMAALAEAGGASIPRMPDPILRRLRTQAALQVASRDKERPLFKVQTTDPDFPRRGLALLPPTSPGDIFFDIEGFPFAEGGLEYLLGAVVVDNNEPRFFEWWAHDAIEESASFEAFVDFAHNRWRQNPEMHIYHYAAYETSAVRRLMGRYATREREVDDLLRNGVFVDLHTVVRQGLIVGTPSYSLKEVERLYEPPREGTVKTAGASIVAYQKWLDSNEPRDWNRSENLREIRDYNRADCESIRKLSDWLRGVQRESGIGYLPRQSPPEGDREAEAPNPATVLAERLLKDVKSNQVVENKKAIQCLLAWLLEFHWREAKPVFWRMFDRSTLTPDELSDDLDCLGNLSRTAKPGRPVDRSMQYEYAFDPDQDTKLHAGSKCFFSHDLKCRCTIETLDTENGLVEIKIGPSVPTVPDRLSLIPDEYVAADAIARAVFRFVDAWSEGSVLSTAVDDLLNRRPPRIKEWVGGALVDETHDLVPQVVDLVRRMESTVLCVQGPPGTGKTFTAASAILALLAEGKRVGVTANSHKAILNVMDAVARQAEATGVRVKMVKVGGDPDDQLLRDGKAVFIESGSGAADALEDGCQLLGGTAWVFSRDDLAGEFDHLFIDEAGQFSLANVVGVGLSARNLVLVGDQMQLAQPILGAHPEDSGQSALEYLLNGRATIAPDFGVFLGVTRRMHPDICCYISDAFYEGRLHPDPRTARQHLVLPAEAAPITKSAGIVFVPIEHTGNTQDSDEESEAVGRIVKVLLQSKVHDADNESPREVRLDDILLVAPYNMQVRRLQRQLGVEARVGSVDKFQGQEAHIVIVSLCSSSLEDSPRGAAFLLDPNRLNVAVSRAKTLSIVVASPKLMAARCKTIREMELVNLLCWLVHHGQQVGEPLGAGRQALKDARPSASLV